MRHSGIQPEDQDAADLRSKRNLLTANQQDALLVASRGVPQAVRSGGGAVIGENDEIEPGGTRGLGDF